MSVTVHEPFDQNGQVTKDNSIFFYVSGVDGDPLPPVYATPDGIGVAVGSPGVGSATFLRHIYGEGISAEEAYQQFLVATGSTEDDYSYEVWEELIILYFGSVEAYLLLFRPTVNAPISHITFRFGTSMQAEGESNTTIVIFQVQDLATGASITLNGYRYGGTVEEHYQYNILVYAPTEGGGFVTQELWGEEYDSEPEFVDVDFTMGESGFHFQALAVGLDVDLEVPFTGTGATWILRDGWNWVDDIYVTTIDLETPDGRLMIRVGGQWELFAGSSAGKGMIKTPSGWEPWDPRGLIRVGSEWKK